MDPDLIEGELAKLPEEKNLLEGELSGEFPPGFPRYRPSSPPPNHPPF